MSKGIEINYRHFASKALYLSGVVKPFTRKIKKSKNVTPPTAIYKIVRKRFRPPNSVAVERNTDFVPPKAVTL